MLEIVGCPDCHAPAEITDRFTLPSTDGHVDHVVVVCSAGHRFRMPAEGLSAPADAASANRTRRLPERVPNTRSARSER